MPTKDDKEEIGDLDTVDGRGVMRVEYAPVPENDPQAPSTAVSSKRQRISDLWTIFCAGFALISDGYQNSLMTMINVVLETEYADQYTSTVATRVSNALLVGEIFGQIVVGYAAHDLKFDVC